MTQPTIGHVGDGVPGLVVSFAAVGGVSPVLTATLLALALGPNLILVKAVDGTGLATTVPVHVTRI